LIQKDIIHDPQRATRMDKAEKTAAQSPSQRAPRAVGIDLGATLAKITSRDLAGQLHFETLPAEETDRLKLRIESLEPEQVGLTGGGASRLAEMLEIPSRRHDEFASWGAGARQLLEAEAWTGDTPSLLISLGTGTSVMLMDGDSTVRIGGTAIGGGTILGLGSALLGINDFDEICALAQQGDRTHVDLMVSDIYRPGEISLPDNLTAASFGKLGLLSDTPGGKEPKNLAAAILGLVGENVGLICGGLSYVSQAEQIVFGGSTLRGNPFLRDVLAARTHDMGRKPVFLPHCEFGGATGALILCGVED
jgi:type II pantothenate kinase